ncbi:helix-turn-helix transcriptional regulator [Pseudophaeobacter sp. EL27]|uniref:ArsR/SmtB family transcription factor n=1 Tax=Pseudophaeobacter sp. EL27 TaxID=2107580 RepID=UPI000EFCA728|nr:metalloregulator ArsR/SmtB family transcription factor [Pseudophaeobacter sp. EL27]
MTTPRFDIIGQALSDASRTRMLCELMEGRSFTNKELASAAGITAQTATAHLRLLQNAGLVLAEKRGRCVFHRLANAEVAQVLEQLAALAPSSHLHLAQRRKAGDIAQLRSCYDHLAGPVAVAMTGQFLDRGMLVEENGGFRACGHEIWPKLGVSLPQKPSAVARHQPFARPCMDWTERRLHVSGLLGKQILTHFFDQGWVRRNSHKRGLQITGLGLRALEQVLGLRCEALIDA